MSKNDTNLQRKKKYLMYPFVVITVYILITMVINLFGPIEYQDYTRERKIVVTIYMLVFLVVTYLGMKLAAVSGNKSEAVLERNRTNVRIFVLVLEWMIAAVFLIKAVLLVYQFYRYGISISGLGFSALAEVYSNLHASEGDYNFFRKINSFTRVFMFISFFSGTYMWKRLKLTSRVLLVCSIILDFLYNVLYVGTQRSLFTYIVLGGMLYIVYMLQHSRRVKKRTILCVLLGVGLIVILFTKVIGARYALWGSMMSTEFRNGMRFLPDHAWVRWMPDSLKYAFITLLSYPSQGYYGLAMCLEMPFQWTFFLGGFRGINSIVSQFLPGVPDFLAYTYPVRTGEAIGFDGLAGWYTIFPWLASDFTFLGALIIMMLAAYFFMVSWKEVILYHNPLSFAMLIQLVILYIFVPANNQLFVDRGDSLGMVMLCIVWILFHKRLNYREEIVKK